MNTAARNADDPRRRRYQRLRLGSDVRRTPRFELALVGSFVLVASETREIDEFDIHVIPVLIGEGIPLVAPRHGDVRLRLRSAKKYPDGVVRLRYEVAR
jgi:dihydrofolate reductase